MSKLSAVGVSIKYQFDRTIPKSSILYIDKLEDGRTKVTLINGESFNVNENYGWFSDQLTFNYLK